MIRKKIMIGFAVSGVLAATAAIAPDLGAGASASVPARAHAASGITVIDASKDALAAGTAINTNCNPSTNCSFDDGGQVPTVDYGPTRAIGDAVYNCGQTYAADKVEITDERSSSTSIDAELTASVKVGILTAEASAGTKDTNKLSNGTGTDEEVAVAPGEKGWIDTRVPTSSVTGAITDGSTFKVINFQLNYPGYGSGDINSIFFKGVHEKISGDDQRLCSGLILNLPPSGLARGAGPGFPITICRSNTRHCTTRFVTGRLPAIRGNTRVALVRGTRVYASGTAGKTRIVLHARRRVPRGAYLLLLSGPHQNRMLSIHVR